jgi:hypothetical protein
MKNKKKSKQSSTGDASPRAAGRTDEENPTTRTQLPSPYLTDEENQTTRTQLPSPYLTDEENQTTRTQLPSPYHQDEENPTTRTQLPSPYTNTVFLFLYFLHRSVARAQKQPTYLRYGLPI